MVMVMVMMLVQVEVTDLVRVVDDKQTLGDSRNLAMCIRGTRSRCSGTVDERFVMR